jgi:ssDNA-binding Zn-finger/Zn-ribbon topoisomerase 1
MSPDQQQEIGPLTGLPINPCPRCGDRVLELRSRKDGEVFFKCDGNDQDVN